MLSFAVNASSNEPVKTITGKVVDEATNDPLPGASVVVKGTTIGVTTDFDGNFSIDTPDDATTLVVSFIGYATKELTIGNLTNITIKLGEDASALDEIIVTALGITRSKDEVTYAAQTLKASSVNVSRSGDISKQLIGLVPGLKISSNAGSGVSSSKIVLRGESSLNIGGNEPLIILDGVPILNNFNGLSGGNSRENSPIDYGSGLTDINPDDIKDITVLKGPKAAALYGSRGGNGALVIRTTSGRQKEGAGINYSSGVSFDKVTRFWDVQNKYSGGQYNSATGQYDYRAYGGYGLLLDGSNFVQPQVEEWYTGTGTATITEPRPLVSRFKSKDFFNTGVTTNNHLSYSFSDDEKIFGRISVSNQNTNGIVPNTGYNKKGISLRLEAELTDKLSIDFSGNYVNSSSDNVPVQGTGDNGREGLAYALLWAPNNIDINAYKNNYWVFNADGVRRQRSNPAWITNPLIITEENLNNFDRKRFFGNVKTSYKFSDQLSAFLRAGIDTYNDNRVSRRAVGQYYFPTGMYREQKINDIETNIDFLVNYNTTINDIGFDANVGGNMLHRSSSNFQARVDQLTILDVYNFGNAIDRPQIISENTGKKVNSIYSSLQLDYKKYLFLDFTARNDWSSTLSPENNSYFYPSVGASYIISKMATLPESINHLQVRASWAETGNDTDPEKINESYFYGTLPGSTTNRNLIVDPNLRPERVTALEAGLNLRMFQNRLDFEFNVYKNATKDQILSVPISTSTGANARVFNAGLVENSGIEILLKTTPIKNDDFRWDFSINWSKNQGKVIELTEGVETFILAKGPSLPGVTVQARPGGRMGDIYGRDYERHNGQIIWKDVGGLATASYADDLVKVGNYNPDWTSGFVSSLTYKGINLRVVGEYRHGGDLYTETGSRLYQTGKDSETLARETTPTVVPAGVMLNGSGEYVANTISLPYFNYARRIRHWENAALNTFDASFFKLREVSLSTDLKDHFTKLPFTKLQVSIFGRNLYTYTKSKELRHFDPESFMINNGNLVPGIESGQLPTPSTYGVNIKIGL